MAQPVMTQFWPLFPARSDGHEQISAKGVVVRNAPNAQQLDQTPNELGQADYYRLLAWDEPKHIDWRKKLGGMLLRELGGKQYEDKWTQCILWDLPEGYRLYEHIKSKSDGTTKPVKNHSGGGHDRQDAYLYGHPKGPKKRFRSPVEFFPHLLWLSTDETGQYDNCTCKLCCPTQPESEKPAAKAETPANSPKVKIEETATPPSTASVTRNPAAQIPRLPTAGSANTQSPSTRASPNVARIKPPSALVSAPLPQPRSIDQQVDSQYNKFLCRTGEVVWFYRERTKAWGLGLVVRRWIPKDGSSNRAHLIQPLSHPYMAPEKEVITLDNKIKPWLAWSAPSCTYSLLQQNNALTYEQVDWNALLSGHYGNGEAEVDASILAAKAVDETYTLFERLKTTTSNLGHEERHWNGLYFGAEKIWNGDPVRLRIGSGADIMVVTDIIERIIQLPSNGPNPSISSNIQLVGDIYTYATLPAPDPSNPPQPAQSTNIPLRMREDMRWRNQTLIPDTQTTAYWKLISSQSRLDIVEIKGRWYETSLVYVDSFHKAVKNNEGGNGIWMNSRGAAAGLVGAGTRKEERVEAFGNAVPKNTTLVEGLDPPPEVDQQKRPPANEMQHLELSNADGGFALDDFMNLDGMDDGGMTFGDDFPFG
ncbi:hypothetical protein CC78DRAFT_350986 [Lojkania enalia]|uniref:Transcription-silencing protein Clr2 n=1 Tax=Lojkania enalia TaxID=147567 RepID=A0A9P4KIM8_9PLEO|nr:hypothetical protein CC78DRAFT_350986 [Didymosphaeria enalia]